MAVAFKGTITIEKCMKNLRKPRVGPTVHQVPIQRTLPSSNIHSDVTPRERRLSFEEENKFQPKVDHYTIFLKAHLGKYLCG